MTQQQVFHFPRRDDSSGAVAVGVIHEDAMAGSITWPAGRDGGAGDDRKIAEHDAWQRDDRRRRGTAWSTPALATGSSRYVQRLAARARTKATGRDDVPVHRTPSEDFILDRVGPIRRVLAVLRARREVRAA